MSGNKSLFWEDLNRDMQDPNFRAEFLLQSARIGTIDRVINALDEARIDHDLSKAALARAIGSDPAVVRRLFSAHGNPTLGTLAEIAAALGMEVTLTPLPKDKARVFADLRKDSALPAPKASPTSRSQKPGKSSKRTKRRVTVPA